MKSEKYESYKSVTIRRITIQCNQAFALDSTTEAAGLYEALSLGLRQNTTIRWHQTPTNWHCTDQLVHAVARGISVSVISDFPACFQHLGIHHNHQPNNDVLHVQRVSSKCSGKICTSRRTSGWLGPTSTLGKRNQSKAILFPRANR